MSILSAMQRKIMIRLGILAIYGCLLVTFAAIPARAQLTSFLPVRVKVGFLNLQDGDARRIAGPQLYMAEADLFIPSIGAGKTLVSAGFQDRSSHGNTLRVIPVTVSRIYSPINPAQVLTGNIYYGAGIGAYFLQGTSGGSSESKTRPGGFGVIGYQFPISLFVEAKYQVVTGGVAGVYPNGVLLAVGKKF